MRQLIVSLALVLTALFTAPVALAQETEVTCTSVYGGGVVCGVKTHEAVPAALGDFNPALMGAGLIIASGLFVYLSKRVKRNSSQVIG